jgi:hypothetical protein
VKIVEPEMNAAPLSAWRGTWQATALGATITVLPENHKLHAWFETTYQFTDRKVIDCMDGTAMPQGSVVSFNNPSDHDSCDIRLMLVGSLMVVTAKDECTSGYNMSYDSFYIRVSKSRPVSGQC